MLSFLLLSLPTVFIELIFEDVDVFFPNLFVLLKYRESWLSQYGNISHDTSQQNVKGAALE